MTVEGIPGSSPLYHTPAQHYSEDVAEATRVLPHELIIVDDSKPIYFCTTVPGAVIRFTLRKSETH